MSHNLWFLWLILGLKLPLIGLFYFIFRIMRAQDKAWEQGELGGDWHDDDGGGGGGEPRIEPPRRPRGPGVRRRQPRPRAPRPAARGLPVRRAPRRRSEPLRTHDPRPAPQRTAGS